MILLRYAVAAVALSVASPLLAADGKAVFLDKKCNLCHSVDSQQIQRTSEKMKGSDLSSVGGAVESADWVKSYLTKKVQKDGADHRREFKGTDEELDALVEWLLTLKTS
jgi:cytochrome c551/c552